MPSKTKIALVSSLLGSLASAAYSNDKINSLREAIGKIEPQLAKLNSDYWEQTEAHQKINHNVLVLKDYADRGIVLTPVEKNYISNFEPYLPEWKEHLDNQWRAIERLMMSIRQTTILWVFTLTCFSGAYSQEASWAGCS